MLFHFSSYTSPIESETHETSRVADYDDDNGNEIRDADETGLL